MSNMPIGKNQWSQNETRQTNNSLDNFTCSVRLYVRSLLVPPSIPGTKISTRLYVQCVVNSLHNYTFVGLNLGLGVSVGRRVTVFTFRYSQREIRGRKVECWSTVVRKDVRRTTHTDREEECTGSTLLTVTWHIDVVCRWRSKTKRY